MKLEYRKNTYKIPDAAEMTAASVNYMVCFWSSGAK